MISSKKTIKKIEIKAKESESCERNADASVRFCQHPSGNIIDAFMEPIDNGFTCLRVPGSLA